MEHVVFYPAADGAPAFRRVASLDEAVRFVEHLRNVEDVSDFSVHELTHVPLSFKAYYKAEVPAQTVDELPVADLPVAEVPAVAAPADIAEASEAEAADPVLAEPVDVPAVAEAAEPAEALPVAEVPAPAESEESAAPADSRKSLSFFAR